MISLPRDPADTRLDSVFAGTDVLTVITWTEEGLRNVDSPFPFLPNISDCLQEPPAGGCLRAVRQPGEEFAGSLTEIRGDMAYWVLSSESSTIRVTLDFSRELPSPRLHKGWNLVPITTGAPAVAGTQLDADSALGTAKWAVALTFITDDNRWEKLAPGEGAMVVVGRGYWLWVTQV